MVVNAYCTVDEVRDQLADDGSRLDAGLLEKAVNATSRAIDKHCSGGVPGSRRFWRDASATVHVFRPDDPTVAWVDDISSAAGVAVKTDEDGDGTFETTWTAGADYQLEPLNSDVVAGGDTVTPYAFWMVTAVGLKRFPVYALYPQRAGLQVTARFGWPAIPDDVNTAAIIKTVRLFKRKDSPIGFQGFGDFGPVRISRFEDPDVTELLRPFEKRRTRTLNYTPQRYSLFHGYR